jgi:hypothetical protein
MVEFTPTGYRALLRAFAERGYEVRGFADVASEKRHLILRHDIDVSIEAALAIAEIERELGVGASYFVRLRSGLYNPFEPVSLEALLRLRDLGHEVGLHFDASLYGEDENQLDAGAERECAVLESMLGAPVAMTSFHRPARALLGLERRFAGRAHAYQPRYFREIGYCSDSRGAWHHGYPLEHAAVVEGRALQLLTHPVWWTGRPDADVTGRLDDFVAERAAAMRHELRANIESYTRTPAESGTD